MSASRSPSVATYGKSLDIDGAEVSWLEEASGCHPYDGPQSSMFPGTSPGNWSADWSDGKVDELRSTLAKSLLGISRRLSGVPRLDLKCEGALANEHDLLIFFLTRLAAIALKVSSVAPEGKRMPTSLSKLDPSLSVSGIKPNASMCRSSRDSTVDCSGFVV